MRGLWEQIITDSSYMTFNPECDAAQLINLLPSHDPRLVRMRRASTGSTQVILRLGRATETNQQVAPVRPPGSLRVLVYRKTLGDLSLMLSD